MYGLVFKQQAANPFVERSLRSTDRNTDPSVKCFLDLLDCIDFTVRQALVVTQTMVSRMKDGLVSFIFIPITTKNPSKKQT